MVISAIVAFVAGFLFFVERNRRVSAEAMLSNLGLKKQENAVDTTIAANTGSIEAEEKKIADLEKATQGEANAQDPNTFFNSNNLQ